MGRLRTAIRTLARLELPPAETLQQLDELMHELGVREPHFATCVYAIFDASGARANIDSPKNAAPSDTPYSPPTSSPSLQASIECANPRSNSRV